MGFQMQICSILRSLGRFWKSVVFICENELQQNSNASSRENYIPQMLTVLLEIHRVYI